MWTKLPTGQAVSFKAGNYYAAIARILSTHSTAEIQGVAQANGFTVLSLQDPAISTGLPGAVDPTNSSYHFIEIYGQAGRSLTEPWSAPFPFSLVDGSGFYDVWEWSGANAPDSLPWLPIGSPIPQPPSLIPASPASPASSITAPSAPTAPAPTSDSAPLLIIVGGLAVAGLIGWSIYRSSKKRGR